MKYPFVILTLVTALMAGCGQKGPLYFPDDEDAPEALVDPDEHDED